MKDLRKKEKTALLFGASGLVGGYCLRILLENKSYNKVKTFGRRELPIKHPKLEQHLINFEKLSTYKDLLLGDDVFCCLGTTMKKAGSKEAFYKVDFTYGNEIARMTAANHCQQFLLVSSIGAYSNSVFFYNKVKGQLEEAVKHYPFSGIHLFRPAVLVGEREEHRFGEEIAVKLGQAFNFMTSGKLLKYRPIEGKIVANAMVKTALSNQAGIHTYESDAIQRM